MAYFFPSPIPAVTHDLWFKTDARKDEHIILLKEEDEFYKTVGLFFTITSYGYYRRAITGVYVLHDPVLLGAPHFPGIKAGIIGLAG